MTPMELQLVTAPSGLLVEVQDVKGHIELVESVRDTLVTEYIKAATELVQRMVPGGRQLLQATYDGLLCEFPAGGGVIEFPKPPLASISSLSYYDVDNASQSLTSADWLLVTPTDAPGHLRPAVDTTWPSTKARPDAVTIRFVAGYASGSVPEIYQQAVRLIVGHWFENREAAADRTLRTVPLAVQELVAAGDYGWYG